MLNENLGRIDQISKNLMNRIDEKDYFTSLDD
jgi:hypothetical protein